MPDPDFSIHRFPYGKIPAIAHRDLAYIEEHGGLRPFYKYSPEIESFRAAIVEKSKSTVDRDALVRVLGDQYRSLQAAPKLAVNIELLTAEKTFTVTTAHQPSLFTGPLYFIYKIFSTINLAEKLAVYYPDYQFVPVFVIGGEDHDFKEINHLNLFGKTLTWEHETGGSVGLMKTDSLKDVLATLKGILGESENAQRIFSILEETHVQNQVYQDAVQDLLNRLFGEYGLVVLNMNHPALKKLFVPIMEDDLLKNSSFKIVNQTVEKLAGVGFHAQANPREINLFYLRENFRERIVFEGGDFKVLNSDIRFSEVEILVELHQFPERFSPNVVLRPLFQETVLPNLAYVGGGGELAYWQERKAQFEYYNVPSPVLIRRNSVLFIDAANHAKIQKLGFTWQEFFENTEQLVRHFLEKNAGDALNFEAEKAGLEQLFQKMAAKTEQIDPTLVKTVFAEGAANLKSFENLESRIIKAEKHKQEANLNQLRALKEKLFPGSGLQERHDNFLAFYLKYGDRFFQLLKEILNPLNKEFLVIVEN